MLRFAGVVDMTQKGEAYALVEPVSVSTMAATEACSVDTLVREDL